MSGFRKVKWCCCFVTMWHLLLFLHIHMFLQVRSLVCCIITLVTCEYYPSCVFFLCLFRWDGLVAAYSHWSHGNLIPSCLLSLCILVYTCILVLLFLGSLLGYIKNFLVCSYGCCLNSAQVLVGIGQPPSDFVCSCHISSWILLGLLILSQFSVDYSTLVLLSLWKSFF